MPMLHAVDAMVQPVRIGGENCGAHLRAAEKHHIRCLVQLGKTSRGPAGEGFCHRHISIALADYVYYRRRFELVREHSIYRNKQDGRYEEWSRDERLHGAKTSST